MGLVALSASRNHHPQAKHTRQAVYQSGPKQYYPVYPARPSIKCPCRASKWKKVCELHSKSYFILHVLLVQAAYFPGPWVHNPTFLVLNRELFEIWEMAIFNGLSSLQSFPKCLRNYSTLFIESWNAVTWSFSFSFFFSLSFPSVSSHFLSFPPSSVCLVHAESRRNIKY